MEDALEVIVRILATTDKAVSILVFVDDVLEAVCCPRTLLLLACFPALRDFASSTILVVVDDALEVAEYYRLLAIPTCFNPCCRG